ncbi:MAG: septum formation initiator family protein [Proteobacteria bacterium]|nr:septum formation initiator family protein [Desulfobacula sp.]MBU4131100.1 septum formation initiator family protein [Pseudomonadota bacterium]
MTIFEKAGFYVGILLTLVLLLLIFFSKNGIMEYGNLKKQEAEIAVQAAQTEKENRKIEKEINSLKHDMNYIKHLAKHEHEMAEPDELIFKNASERKDTKP